MKPWVLLAGLVPLTLLVGCGETCDSLQKRVAELEREFESNASAATMERIGEEFVELAEKAAELNCTFGLD